jgi:hypothetical protein
VEARTAATVPGKGDCFISTRKILPPRIRRNRLGVVIATLAALLAPASAATAADVVGQWRFDDAAGSQRMLDDGPFGLDGRLGETAAADSLDPTAIPGLNGGGLRFDSAAYVRLPNAAELAPRTISVEAVVRGAASPGQFRYVVSRGANDCVAGSYGLYTGRSTGMEFYIYDGNAFYVSAGAAPAAVWDGAWHHVAGVFDGASLRLYVDGHPVGDAMPAAVRIAYGLTSTDMYFGTYRGSCALPLSGDLDLVRIWSGALGAGGVAALADTALTPAAAPGPEPGPAPGTGGVPTEPAGQGPPRAPLAPAEPGRTIGGVGAPGAPPRAAPGAPPRACSLRVARVRGAAGGKVVGVRAHLRGRPLRRVRVIAKRRGKRIGAARTGRDGRASVRLARGARGRVSLTVAGRRDCSTASVTLPR